MGMIAAIIVTYNRLDKLRNCIEAVMGQTVSEPVVVMVIDNNSTDGTGEWIKNYADSRGVDIYDDPGEPVVHAGGEKISDRSIVYCNLSYNSGGAGGFCYGIRKAVEAGCDYLWLMDDDCIPEADALCNLLSFDAAHKGEYGFLSSRVLWKDGSLCRMNLQRERVFRNISIGRLQHAETPMRVEMASFVSLFIPAQIVREVGLPFRKFFIWTDDWEYTRRISAEYPCWVIPGSNVVHETDTSEGADISTAPAEKLGRFTYLYRNDVYLYRREGLKGVAYEAARLTVHAARIMTSGYDFREKKKRLAIMINGTAEGIEFFPEPERVNPPDMELKK